MTQLVSYVLLVPLAARLVVLALVGAIAGRWINRGIYRLSHRPRDLGPWRGRAGGAGSRRVVDFMPILGWWSLRRESEEHGAGYWLRPLAIEIAVAIGLPLLYYWEIQGGLLPKNLLPLRTALQLQSIAHAQFLGHAVLFGLIIVATFIDFDERLIPDTITIPGALAGLAWSAVMPDSLLWSAISSLALNAGPSPLLIATPTATWPPALDRPLGVIIGLVCLAGWCAALYPATIALHKGWRKGIDFFIVSIFRRLKGGRRSLLAWSLLVIWVAGSIAICIVWKAGGTRWEALLSSLVGLAAGGGLVWAVRIIAGTALGKEAMGFGDVTLMAMIGAFVGWQGALLVFFLAPFAALLIAIAQKMFSGNPAIAFGPYLSFAAMVLIVAWNPIWNKRAAPVFTLGWMIPGILVFCLLLMGGMLWGYRGLLSRPDDDNGGGEKKKKKKKPKK
jgi:prepilin signal peptidase PulO-like enzyme (type II secretory pathway)